MRILFTVLFVFVISLISLSPSNGKKTDLLFENFTIRNGLPTNTVQEIVQDTTGFLWLATLNGLSRFDGENFRNYYFKPDEPYTLPSNIINNLYISAKGDLWIATWNGLCKYDPIYDRFECYIPNSDLALGASQNIISAIDETKDGTIYCLSVGGYLYSIENGNIHTRLNLQQDECKILVIDDNDRCWVSSKNIVFRFDIKSNLTTRFNIQYRVSIQKPEITDMIVSDTALFISSYNSDLIKYNYITGNHTYFNLADGLFHTTSLWKQDNNLYVGTSEGLKIMNLKTNEIITYADDYLNEKSISSNSILDVFIDKQSNLWIGTIRGLNVAYKNRGFQGYHIFLDDINNDINVNTICKDASNQLWLGYTIGFEVFDKNNTSVKFFNKKEGLLPTSQISEVFCIYEDSQKNIWIGTYINGLLKYDPETKLFRQYYPGKRDYDIPGADVRDIQEDAYGNLWIVIHGKGIYVLKEGMQHFIALTKFAPNIPEALNQSWAFDIDFDRNNNLWVTSNLGGYYYNFTTKQYVQFNQSEASLHYLSNNYIPTIFIDSRNTKWLAGRNGLNIISDDLSRFKILNQETGLPNNEIQAIIEDNNGKLWASTNNGIVRIVYKHNFDFEIMSFDRSHGLHSNDFSRHSALLSDDSTIYFGGSSGYTCFKPQNIVVDSIPPKIVMTNFYVFNKKVDIRNRNQKQSDEAFYLEKHIHYTKEIRIKEKFSMIGFEFSALNLIHSDKNQYQYKLDGLDEEWRNIGNRNIIYFSNLNPGSYVFKVKGANNFGIWNHNPLEIKLVVVPPFWKSKYASVVYIVLIMIFFLFLMHIFVQKEKMRLKVEQQNKIKELQTRFFMNVSHELKTPLTLISIPLKKIVKQYKDKEVMPSEGEINMVHRNVNRLIRIMNQLFDFRRIELNKATIEVTKADIVEFTITVLTYFEHQIKQNQIDIITDFPDEEIAFYFDTDKMDKIIYNLISNALKHTPDKGEIKIAIKTTTKNQQKQKKTKYLQWIITDNGDGIPESKREYLFNRFAYSYPTVAIGQSGTGIGLSIVKEFVRLHHGKISIHSQSKKDGYQNSFTTVQLEFPIDEKLYRDNQIIDYRQDDKQKAGSNRYLITKITKQRNNTFDEKSDSNIENDSAYTALIIDDDRDICQLLKAEFTSNYKVCIAHNGKDGIAKAEEFMPDIIISDIMMPEINGYELCKVLKTNLSTSHIPIILLTGKSTGDAELEAYSTGADAYISKPFDMNTLLGRVDALITSRIQLKRAFLSSYGIELKKVVPTNADEKFMKDLLKLIHNHISDHAFNAEKITREIGMSRSMLYKKLKSLTNTSVNVFIRKIRLQKATEFIDEGKMSITEVAYAVGFENLPYFSKCFQDEYGVSPSKYKSDKQA